MTKMYKTRLKLGDTVQIGEAVVQVQVEVSKRHGRTQHSAILIVDAPRTMTINKKAPVVAEANKPTMGDVPNQI